MKPLIITFLQQLYRRDKKLFLLVALYACGILYYCSRQREEFPFLLYGMYSLKEEPQKLYTTYIVQIGSQQVSFADISDAKKGLITSTIENAVKLYDSGNLDQAGREELKVWLCGKRFGGACTGEEFQNLNIYRLSCSYDGTGRPEIMKKELVF